MSLLLRFLLRTRSIPLGTVTRPALIRRPIVLWSSAFAAAATAVSLSHIHLDALQLPGTDVETKVDPATSIEFPTKITVPSKQKYPELTLLGLGVRTVSFLGIKVYSVGFYADISSPNLKFSSDMSAEEKANHIVQNAACVIRIIPTRTTNYTHLRDAFMRALYGRLSLGKQQGNINEEMAIEVSGPMRKLKTLFPNSPLQKHTPFDVFLTPPIAGKPRSLVFRDMGSIENDWVATEFVLHYFEGTGPSPPLKNTVMDSLENLNSR